jgi:cytochrome c553
MALSTVKDIKVVKDDEQDVTESLRTFESRWKYAVFPAMVMFVLLIGFMFFLIWGMLQRMEDLAEDIDTMTKVMGETLPVMQGGVVGMSSRMQWVGDDMKKMSEDMHNMSNVITEVMPNMNDRVKDMSNNISEMSFATNTMAVTTHNMGQNIWDMNRNFSKPLSMMNKIIPFSNKDRPPRPMPLPMWNGPQQMAGYPANNLYYGMPVAGMPEGMAEVTQKAPLNISEDHGQKKFAGFCASCHGKDAEGGVGPSLHGKKAEYIIQVLHEYRDGKRSGTMTGVLKVISDVDIKNVAEFIGHTYQNQN